MTDLSIIIISYNTKAITKKCLDTIVASLKNPSFKTEILVIDNNSPDDSQKMLKEYEKTLKSKHVYLTNIFSKDNSGYAKANNKAVKQAKGDYLLIMNSDIEVLDNAIEDLYEYYRQQNEYQFVGAKLYNKDMSEQASAAPFYTPLIVFAALFLKGDYWGLTRNSPNSIKRVDWVSGACFITKREYYDSISGFDENIFMYMDEVDFFFRAAKKHLKTGFLPSSHFIHLGSASSKGRTQPILQVYKGFLYFYKKHYNKTSLFLLRCMLQLKAVISLAIGKMQVRLKGTDSNYLVNTYEEALRIAQSA